MTRPRSECDAMNAISASQPILELERSTIEAVVQKATQSQAAQPTDWRVSKLTGGRETESSIYRVDVDVNRPNSATLSFILKVVRMTAERRSTSLWLDGKLAFGESPALEPQDWHHAPRRQVVAVLAGALEIEVGDGSKRRFAPGDCFRMPSHFRLGFGASGERFPQALERLADFLKHYPAQSAKA